ncbi:MAG: F-type H+-transporting ATPase subunit epsilon [Variibacter sp.]|jgi:F-type H+-transporting ATPase subunit epsilon|nr:F-type H+-transporting ATPase subunit epsilon [Variibacter sp.]
MATFHFELVSPERLLFSGEVDQVDVPGAEGDFGVLAGHAPMVSTLKPGILTVIEGGNRRRIVVFGGFAEISPNGLTVLADNAAPVEDIDNALIAAEIKDLEEDIADTTDAQVRDKARRKLDQLRAVQALVAGGAPAAAH